MCICVYMKPSQATRKAKAPATRFEGFPSISNFVAAMRSARAMVPRSPGGFGV